MCDHILFNRPSRCEFNQRLCRREPISSRVLPQRVKVTFKPMMDMMPVRAVLMSVVRRVMVRPTMMWAAMFLAVFLTVWVVLRHVILPVVHVVDPAASELPATT